MPRDSCNVTTLHFSAPRAGPCANGAGMDVAGRVGVGGANSAAAIVGVVDGPQAVVMDLGRVVPARLRGPAAEHDAQRACVPALGAFTPSPPAVPAPPRGGGIGRALVAASVLHLAVFAGLWAQPASGIGGSEQPLEAISVEIVMLPAVPVAAAVAPSPPAAATPPEAVTEPPEPARRSKVAVVEPEAPKIAETKPDAVTAMLEAVSEREQKPAPAPMPELVPAPVLLTDDAPPPEPDTLSQAVVAERDAPQTDDVLPPTPSGDAAHQRDGEVAPKPDTSETTPPEPDVPAAPVAASSSSASQPDVRATPAPSASPGELRRFARDVARALARTPPKTVRRTGTVIVSFTVGADGAIEDAAIRRTSGHAVLDDAALAAVRRASLPKPPADANARQRRFEIPYHFRRRS